MAKKEQDPAIMN